MLELTLFLFIMEQSMAAEIPPDVNHALTLCGFATEASRNRLWMNEGFESLAQFGDFTSSELDAMAKRNEERRPAAQRVTFGITRLKKLKAVTFWVKRQRREGVDINMDNLTADLMPGLMIEMNLAEEEKDKVTDQLYPEKFDPKKYKVWAISMENYLDATKGYNGVPLSYVIRPDDVQVNEATSRHERLIWSAPHTGVAYQEDNRTVYRVYKDRLTGTLGWTWFEQAENGNGRQAHQLLRDHYQGDGEVSRLAAEADAKLKALHYKNEAAFPFERYISKMKDCFDDLRDNQDPRSGRSKVNTMLNGMISTDPQIAALKMVIRDRYPVNFEQASGHAAQQIASIYPAAGLQDNKKRGISGIAPNYQSGNRARGRFGRSPFGRAGRGRGRNPTLCGVNIDDPTRNFTAEEWQKFIEGGHVETIRQMRRGINSGRGRFGRGRGRGRYGRGRGGGRGNYNNYDYYGPTGSGNTDGTTPGRGISELETGNQGNTGIGNVSGVSGTQQVQNPRGGQSGAGFGRGRWQSGGRN